MLVDSHCHLDLIDDHLGGVEQLLANAAERDISHFLCVCVGLENADTVRALAEQTPWVLHHRHEAGLHASGGAGNGDGFGSSGFNAFGSQKV